MIKIKVPSSFMEQIQITRYAAGVYVDGKWVDGAPSIIPTTASVQPMSSSERRRLPEGNSGMRAVSVYTNFTLQEGVEGSTRADEILYDGVRYKMVPFEDWSVNGYTTAGFVEIK